METFADETNIQRRIKNKITDFLRKQSKKSIFNKEDAFLLYQILPGKIKSIVLNLCRSQKKFIVEILIKCFLKTRMIYLYMKQYSTLESLIFRKDK